MELDFEKYCVVDGSPTTVLPAPRRISKVSSRKSRGKAKYGNDLLSLNEDDVTGIGFTRYRSTSCRDVKPRRVDQEGNEVIKRSSMYQSSKEVALLKRNDSAVERKKIEFLRGSASALSFGIIDSLCSSDEDSSLAEQSRPSAMSPSEQNKGFFCKSHIELHSQESTPDKPSISAVSSLSVGNISEARHLAVNLQKSLSEKLALPHSPARQESDNSKASSPKSRYRPVRKMFDPFVRSKSYRSLLSRANEAAWKTSEHVGMDRSRTICESQLVDIFEQPYHVENNSQCEIKDNSISVPHFSPAHLNGLLKLENKHGTPFLEFSVKLLEDVYVAKTWKAENGPALIYTFHSLDHHRRKSGSSAWGFKESNRESSILGQMHVSCYRSMKLEGAGASNDSMVTEFVLYDIAHSRNSIFSQGTSDGILSRGDSEQKEGSAKMKNKGQFKHCRESNPFEPSSSQTVAALELHPELEIAAMIMEVPLEKRESLNFLSGDREMDKQHPDMLNVCRFDQAKEGICGSACPGTMHVVLPSGNHGLPSTEGRGPSPLLDRWRSGGGCDCAGWDMACPLHVLGNRNLQIAEGHPVMDNQHPVELYVQGLKETLPAFTMRMIQDGKYAVDFHARLSSLQAFSISVAILHAAEASTILGQDGNENMLRSESLRVFPEEEIEDLINAIEEEENFEVNKKVEDVLPSFVLNPPYSPVARV